MARSLTGIALLLALAACSSRHEAPKVAEGDEHIPCAVSGFGKLQPVCAVERLEGPDGLSLLVRHPDGGFRRFAVVSDGRGLEVADGAQVAVTRLNGDRLDVSVGADRYLFPATRKPHAPSAAAP
ncbi:hypothetical protein EDF56_1011082 [Novosphingobium sp. PhB165]|uniref:hypothetical protein n=1 Tax=Novosphingobium sp. PhB165 TaxID=2485105 RepID=UPI0010476A07|nr:hypothetical protein [Novosphingobium sp. PhB165]TCM22392.1 hypothetical protein EDF56_1011082 [Novosphingobium sp. PhB165]